MGEAQSSLLSWWEDLKTMTSLGHFQATHVPFELVLELLGTLRLFTGHSEQTCL